MRRGTVFPLGIVFLALTLLAGPGRFDTRDAAPATPFADGETWAGHMVFPASSHLFLINPPASVRESPALTLSADREMRPLALERARIAGGEISFTLTWLETDYRFVGRIEGSRMSGVIQATVPNRMLGVSLGNRIVVRGRWDAVRIDAAPEAGLIDRIRSRAASAPDVRFIEWQDRIEPGKGRVGFQHTYLGDGRYVVQDAATGAPEEGFDGRRYWRMRPDGLSEYVAPPESERLQLMAWLRSGSWMPANAGIDLRFEGLDASDGSAILFMQPRGGTVGARIWVDPANETVLRAEVEDEQGLIELSFGAPHAAGGFYLPESWTLSQNDRQTSSRLSEPLRAEAPAALFDNPGVRPRAAFDERRPAEVEVETGRGQKGHHFVHPEIDGYTAGWFLVDSGASDLVIDNLIADRIGMPVIRELSPGVTLRQGGALRIGRLTLIDPVFIARDLSGLTGPEGRERAGILGFPFFASAVVSVDYPNDRIAIHDPATYRLAGGIWEPMQVEARPSIDARVDESVAGRFVVDTGKSARISFRSGFAARHNLLANRSIELTPTETFYGDTFEYRSRLDAVQFAGYRFRNALFHAKIPGTYNSDGSYDGIIGRGFLENFRVVFDYPHERIAFVR
ncbi:MAG: pepsin/retropepsin-like aspartic protease family protein [Rhodothermales bacterium]